MFPDMLLIKTDIKAQLTDIKQSDAVYCCIAKWAPIKFHTRRFLFYKVMILCLWSRTMSWNTARGGVALTTSYKILTRKRQWPKWSTFTSPGCIQMKYINRSWGDWNEVHFQVLEILNEVHLQVLWGPKWSTFTSPGDPKWSTFTNPGGSK